MPGPKKQFVDIIDHWFYQLAGWAINHRWLVLLFSLAFLGSGLYFAGKVQSDNSLDSYFDKTDPTYIAYRDYLYEFQSDEVAYILYRVPDRPHGPFNYDAMKQIGSLTEALEGEVPFVREATSLTNVELIRAEGDSINIDELMIDFPENQEKLLEMRDLVMDRPLYVNYLINEDATYGAIILEMSLSSVNTQDEIMLDPAKGADLNNLYPQVSDVKIREIINRPEFQGIEFFLTGDVHMNATYNYKFTENSTYGTLITLGLLALLSLLLFRISWLGLLGPLVVVVLSIIMVLGIMGAFGWVLGLFFGIVPTLLCAVGVAQSVHIILEYQRAHAEIGDRKIAIQKAIGKVGGACLMAALTTAFGFLVMTFSHLRVLSEMAMYAAAGVMFTLILSLTLLVVFLAGKPGKSKSQPTHKGINRYISKAVEGFIRWNNRYPKQLISGGMVVIAISLMGTSMLRIDLNFMEEFKPHVEWRQHTELAEKVMGGILSLVYIIDTHEADGIKNPELLQAIDKLQQFAESQPHVKKTFSVADIQKDLNRSFHGDDKQWYTIPEDRDLIGQYFLVYEISGGEELEDYVSRDYSHTVLELRVEMVNAAKLQILIDSIDDYLQQNPLPSAEARATGIGLMGTSKNRPNQFKLTQRQQQWSKAHNATQFLRFG